MSVSSFVKLKKGRSKAPKSHDPYGDTYPYIREHLDELAKKLKVRRPTTFEYEDPEFYAEIFGDDIGPEIAARLKQQRKWHNASVGLRTFAALLKHCRAHRDVAAPKNVEAHIVLYELEAFHLILVEAAKK